MRDIIRCGLAMIVCFGALAGIYVLMGATLIGAAQVIVYIGGDQRPDPVRDHAHPDEGRPDPARLPDAGGARRRSRRSSSPCSSPWRSPRPTGAAHGAHRVSANDVSHLLFKDYVLPFEIVSVLLLAAVIGGVFLAKREPGGPS